MKSHLPISNRLSNFRFSLSSPRDATSPRGPISPLTPKSTHLDGPKLESDSSDTTDSISSGAEKQPGLGVTVVESDNAKHEALASPRALPTPIFSPITPWRATFHRHAASTDQETAYLTSSTRLRYGRLVISILLLALGVAVTVLQSRILYHYNVTHLSPQFALSLWPTDINLTPAILTLVTSSTTTLFALLSIVIHVLPSPQSRTTLANALFTILTTLIATPLALATLITSSALSPSAIFSSFVSSTLTALVSTTGPKSTVGLTPNGHGSSPKPETIQSFTCTIAKTATAFNRDAQALALPYLSDVNELVPSGFVRVCTESRASLGLVIGLLGVAVVGVLVAALSWAAQRKIQKLRGEREILTSRDGSELSDGASKMPVYVNQQDLERA